MPGPVGEVWGGFCQVAQEVTPGTLVATAVRRMYWTDPVFTRERESRPKKYATGTRDNVRAHRLGRTVVGGSIKQALSADEILELLELALNDTPTISTPATGTNARDWKYKPGTLASASIEWDDGARVWEVAGARVNRLQIDWGATSEPMVTADFFGTSMAPGTITAALAEGIPTSMEDYEAAVKIGAHAADPTAFSSVAGWAIGGSITVDNQLARKAFAENSNAFQAVSSGEIIITADMLMHAPAAQSLTEYNNWDGNTMRTVRFEYGNNDIIEAALKRTLWVDIPGAWSAFNLGEVDDNTRAYRVSLQYVYDPTSIVGGIQVTARNMRQAVTNGAFLARV